MLSWFRRSEQKAPPRREVRIVTDEETLRMMAAQSTGMTRDMLLSAAGYAETEHGIFAKPYGLRFHPFDKPSHYCPFCGHPYSNGDYDQASSPEQEAKPSGFEHRALVADGPARNRLPLRVDRVQSPDAESNAADASADRGPAVPATRNTSDHGGGRDACHGVPPVEFSTDSWNGHVATSAFPLRRVQTTPGTIADDLGCLAALITLCALAYGLLVLA